VDSVGCASWTWAHGLDPIGTAGDHQGYLLLPWPLPWPRDTGQIEALAELRPLLATAGYRLQLVIAPGDSASRRVVLYCRSAGDRFAGYRRHQVTVDAAEVVAAAAALVQDPSPGAEAAAGPGGWTGASSERDVLICTHGRRDRCCGSVGTDLAMRLLAEGADLFGDDTMVSRTSHTGGHRYAPTAMVFPEGTAWAFADADLLARIVHRHGPVSEVLSRYRGCAGVGSPAIQALERSVLAEVGWGLWDLPRWGEELGEGVVRFHVAGTADEDMLGSDASAYEAVVDPTVRTWEATVTPGRALPMPECGGPEDVFVGTARELAVGPVSRIH
jgi:hypothetical protein